MNIISSVDDFAANASKGVCSIKFGATWCGPCKLMDKVFVKLDAEFDNINCFTVDIDDVPDLARQFNIQSIPTVVVLKDGVELQRAVGVSLIEPLRKAFKDALA